MKLSYRNDTDRCYGAAGMAIGLVVMDGEEMLDGIDVDAEPHEIMEMNQDFFFSGNPSVSAKTAWNRMLRNFNLMTSMMIGNVMCRRMVLDRTELENEMLAALHARLMQEADECCSLEQDEAERLFNKDYTYLHQVFLHRGVQQVARDFAAKIERERRFTRAEMLEELRALSAL